MEKKLSKERRARVEHHSGGKDPIRILKPVESKPERKPKQLA